MLDSGCSDVLGRFLCLAHLPRPNIIKNKLAQEGAPHQFLLPCYGVCRDIWRSCRHTERELGLRRPPVFDCKLYLQDDNECLKGYDLNFENLVCNFGLLLIVVDHAVMERQFKRYKFQSTHRLEKTGLWKVLNIQLTHIVVWIQIKITFLYPRCKFKDTGHCW